MGTTAIARKRGTINAHAEEAARAHTNLNTWGAVVALLESGLLYPGHSHQAVDRVIKIAKAEMQRHLKQYDAARARAGEK